MSANRAPGFTLVEMILASVIAVVLVGLFAFILVPAMRNTTTRSARAELGQAAAVAMRQIASELKGTVGGSLKTYPEGLALTRLKELTPDGRAQYEDVLTVIMHEKNEHVLSISDWRPPTGDPNRWVTPPADLPGIVSSLAHRKQLAAHVEEFQVRLGPVVGIHMLLVNKVAAGEPEHFLLDTQVCLRNTF